MAQVEIMSQVLTPKVKSILRTMHLSTGKCHYTRKLAKLAEVSMWVVSKESSKLERHGMVQQRSRGREKFFKLNLANPRTRKLCELFETEKREKFYNANSARMPVPELGFQWAAVLVLFSRSYLDHIVDRGGRL